MMRDLDHVLDFLGSSIFCSLSHPVQNDREKLGELLGQPDIEERDPIELLKQLARYSFEEVLPMILAWRRSGNLWKVTIASTYLNHSGVLNWIGVLVEEIDSSDRERAGIAEQLLPEFEELALRNALDRVSGPKLYRLVADIFSRMDARTIGLVLRWLRNHPVAARVDVFLSLAGSRNRHARAVLYDLLGLCGPPPGDPWCDAACCMEDSAMMSALHPVSVERSIRHDETPITPD